MDGKVAFITGPEAARAAATRYTWLAKERTSSRLTRAADTEPALVNVELIRGAGSRRCGRRRERDSVASA